MARHRLRNQAGQASRTATPSGAMGDLLNSLVCFSFKFHDASKAKFRCDDREPAYFLSLIDRLRDLSREQVKSLTNAATNRTTRFHRIDFQDRKVSEDGFEIPGRPTCDDESWQFSLSANEHGRVHGFMIENVFYVVWLDPGHRLYA